MTERKMIRLIQEELSSLEELIKENRGLIAAYPDDVALTLTLDNLLFREAKLLQEWTTMKECNGYFDTLQWRGCIGCPEQRNCLERSMAKEKVVAES